MSTTLTSKKAFAMLVKMLHKHNISFKEFIEYCFKDDDGFGICRAFSRGEYQSLIAQGFVWNKTPQGELFWDRLDQEWIEKFKA